MAEVKILRIFKVPAASIARLGKEDLLVEYSLPNGQTLQLRIEKDSPMTSEIEQMVRNDAAHFLPLIGKVLQV